MTKAAHHAQLLVTHPAHGLRVNLDRETTSIGSDERCSVAFTAQKLEPHHCIIQRSGSAYDLFSLASNATVTVNGAAVEATALKSGDKIVLGDVALVFLNPTESDLAGARSLPAQSAPLGPVSAPTGAASPWDSLRSDAELKTAQVSREQVLALIPDDLPERRSFAPEIPEAPEPQKARRGFFALVALLKKSDSTPDVAPAPAAPTPPHAVVLPERHHRNAFAQELVASLRATPYYLLSLLFHALLLVLASMIATPAKPTEREIPPLTSTVAADEGVAEFLDDTEDIPEDVVVPKMPDTSEPEVDAPEFPAELASEDPFDDASDENDSADAVELGTFFGGGLQLEDGGRGLMGGALNVGKGDFGRYIRGLRDSGLDIVFVIDSTGSMGDVLTSARKEIARMIDYLAALVPNSRLGLVTYRDGGAREEYVTRQVDLTPFRYKVVDFLDGVTADGGGDIPEAVLEGVSAAAEMEWGKSAKRLIIVLGDAPGHAQDRSRLERIVREFTRKNGVVHTIYTPQNGDENAAAAGFFGDLAKLGKGSTALLAQGDAVLERVLQLALGREHEKEIRRAMARVAGGPEIERYKKLLNGSESPRRKLLKLKSQRVDPTFLSVLVTENRPEFLAYYLQVLADPSLNDGNRWAAAVLTRRLTQKIGRTGLSYLASRLTPDTPALELEKHVEAFKRSARKAGIEVEVAPR